MTTNPVRPASQFFNGGQACDRPCREGQAAAGTDPKQAPVRALPEGFPEEVAREPFGRCRFTREPLQRLPGPQGATKESRLYPASPSAPEATAWPPAELPRDSASQKTQNVLMSSS